MSKISLCDLAQRLAEKSGISLQDAELFIRKMFDVANEGLQSDKLVKMKWLGTFKVKAVRSSFVAIAISGPCCTSNTRSISWRPTANSVSKTCFIS